VLLCALLDVVDGSSVQHRHQGGKVETHSDFVLAGMLPK
jgi:hypothetical protein